MRLKGKAWIDPQTAEILKIEWIQKPVENVKVFKVRAALANGTLRMTVRTEFSAEKNGLRFPSRIRIEEAYLRPRGRAFIRSKTNVTYRDFKFFRVETEVKSE
jgi:hypothetical protein